MTFKPKKQQIHVPGFGVVQKEDFEQKHFDKLMTRAGDGARKTAFINQYFVVDSYDDLELFKEPKGESEADKKAAEQAAKKAERERLKAEAAAAKEAEDAQKEAEALAKKQAKEADKEAKAKAKKEAEDEAELLRLMEEEEAKKNKSENAK
jgi:hypothetical protein